MTRRRLAGLLVLALGPALVASSSCDPRLLLVQTPFFGGMRADLLEQCCTCLARRGTRAPGASCAQAVIGPDGGIVLPEDAEVIPPNPSFGGDDGDDVIDPPEYFEDDGGVRIPGEIPCSCGVTQEACIHILEQEGRLQIPGACIDQPNIFWNAPCESACAGVLTFDPLPTSG